MSEPHPPLLRRATSDLIVMALTAVVGFVVVAGIVGSIVWEILSPHDADLAELAKRLGDITNTLIGAIVGYLAGRGTTGEAPGIGDIGSIDVPGPRTDGTGDA